MDKGTTAMMGDAILSGLREHEMSHKRYFKARYFPGARIADMKHYSVTLLMKQLEPIVLLAGTNDAPFITPEIRFKKTKGIARFYS